jgi:hypothetical protein
VEGIPASYAVIVGLLILLPGFVTLLIERSLAYSREPANPLLIARSLAYSLVDYTIFSGLAVVSGVESGFRWDVLAPGSMPVAPGAEFDLPVAVSLVALLAIAIGTGAVIGAFKTNDWHMRVARWAGLTQLTGRDSIWSDVFQDSYRKRDDTSPYVVVHLKDGRRLVGWPEYSSNEFHDGPVVFLTNAGWVGDNERLEQIPDPGILVNGTEVAFVQFYTPVREGSHGQG